jgi:WD40 repeat protein
LEKGSVLDYFKDGNSPYGKEELAADGPVLDMALRRDDRNPQFAYSSADKLVYIRNFSSRGEEMVLVGVLHGHEAEVNLVEWSPVNSVWVTGSEDKTVR